jgi:hypothetical protein
VEWTEDLHVWWEIAEFRVGGFRRGGFRVVTFEKLLSIIIIALFLQLFDFCIEFLFQNFFLSDFTVDTTCIPPSYSSS